MTAPLIHPEVEQAFSMNFLDSLFAQKSPVTLWLESDHVSAVCRGWEVERLEEEGEVIGGLA